MVIRGPNVTKGYEANPEANAKAFTDGWFRTGDQGLFDEDGFLLLTGRLKELINRGGEKVSPLEVDGVLSAIPRWRRRCASPFRTPSWARRSAPRSCCAMAWS